MREPLPHQSRAISYADERETIALFMEMRLGKTLVAVRWFTSRDKVTSVLVIAPLTVLGTWAEELEAEGVREIHRLHGEEDSIPSNAKAKPHGVSLASFGRIRSEPWLLDRKWDCIIVDESIAIKNPKAQITKCLANGRTDHIPYRAILTGQPAPEDPIDVFCQMKFLLGSFMGYDNYWAFRHKYFRQVGYGWMPKPGTRKAISQAIRDVAFVLKRKDAGVGSRKIYQKRRVPMNGVQKRLYKEILEDFRSSYMGTVYKTKFVPVQLTYLLRITGGCDPKGRPISKNKTNELIELLKGELKNDQVVVWFKFNQEIRMVSKELKRHGISHTRIVGSDDTDQREKSRKGFKLGKYRVLLAQGKCAKYGLDCSTADTAIYYSNHWDLDTRVQSEDRIISPVKKRPVLYIDLLSEEPYDYDAKVRYDLVDKKCNANMLVSSLLEELCP